MRKAVLSFIVFMRAAAVAGAISLPAAQTGGVAGEYLSYFSGSARAQGMGDAYTSVNGGASSLYYNPASIGGLGNHTVDTLYTSLLGGGNYASLFYSGALGLEFTTGVGIISLNSGEGIKRNQWGARDGKFQDSRTAVYIALARSFDSKYKIGMNLKVLDQKIDNYSDSGAGLDGGFKVSFTDRFDMGVSLQNIVPPELKLINETEKYPLNIKLGMNRRFFLDRSLIISGDMGVLDPAGQSTLRWHLGGEYELFDILFVRGGVNYKNITGGLGVKTDNFGFSYSARYSQPGLFHTVSTSYMFGMLPSKREQRLARKEAILDEREERFEEWKKEREKALKSRLSRTQQELENQVDEAREKNKELEALIQAAMDIRRGDYEKAEKSLNKILERDPSQKDAGKLLDIIEKELAKDFSFNRMMGAYNEGNYEVALRESKKAKRDHPQFTQAQVIGLLSSARIHILNEDFQKAKSALQKVLDIRPESETAKTLLRRTERLEEIHGE
ncbi:MAG: hypothetical protein ACQEQC_05335 [Elusimicrobiota bacterium]